MHSSARKRALNNIRIFFLSNLVIKNLYNYTKKLYIAGLTSKILYTTRFFKCSLKAGQLRVSIKSLKNIWVSVKPGAGQAFPLLALEVSRNALYNLCRFLEEFKALTLPYTHNGRNCCVSYYSQDTKYLKFSKRR